MTHTIEFISCDICNKQVKNNKVSIKLHKKFCPNTKIDNSQINDKRIGQSTLSNLSFVNQNKHGNSDLRKNYDDLLGIESVYSLHK